MRENQLENLLQRIEALEEELEHARNTLESIKSGTSDAIILEDASGQSQVYMVHRANESFVAILDALPEGAVIVDGRGTILYCNRIMATWLREDLQNLLSRALPDYLLLPEELQFADLLPQTPGMMIRREIKLKSGDSTIPVQFACTRLSGDGDEQFGIILSDLTEQKRIQELATSSHLARLLLDQVQEAILIFDKSGKINIHSRLAAELFRRDLYQTDVSDILKNFRFSPAVNKKTIQRKAFDFPSILNKAYFLDLIGRYWDPFTNILFDCNVSAQPLLDENGNVIGGLLKVLDISKSLQQQVDQLLFYSISHLSTRHQSIKKFALSFCKKLSELYDIRDVVMELPPKNGSRDELVHFSVSQAYNAAGMEDLLARIRTEKMDSSENIIHHCDKATGDRVTFLKIQTGLHGTVVLGMRWPEYLNFQDEPISENRLMVLREQLGLAFERILTHREQQLHSLVLNDSPYGIILLNRQYEITWANQSAKIALPELDRKPGHLPLLSQFVKNWREEVADEISGRLNAGESWSGELALADSEGQSKFLDAVFRLVEYDEEVGEAQIVMMFKDITNQKILEQQLFQAQKMEAVGKLAGGVAHDFNNLLTVINGYSDLLLQTLPENSETFKSVAQIRRAGEKAGRLTSQLLAFSRRQIIQPRPLNINQVIQDTEKMLRRLIGEDIVLETDLAADLQNVKLDPGQLDQIILNLAVNARDAMPDGGVLKFKTMNVELREVYSSKRELVKPGKYVLLQISDTGTGMSREVQEKIFEPFFTTKEKGTGLGLSTVYGIVKQHHGYIWVYSEPGMGTTFKIYFPIIESAAEVKEAAPEISEDLTGSETVLLVEDDQWVRKFTALSLEAYGYHVLEAGDGREALKIFEENPSIDIVVTDLVMPRLGGHELSRILKEKSEQLTIIYMSGYTEDAMIRYGVMKKGVNFIQKPFSGIDLVRKIKEVRQKSNLRGEKNEKK
ncbi:MAG: hypothetical protein Kow0037_04410 [Calditrichia bacterium]